MKKSLLFPAGIITSIILFCSIILSILFYRSQTNIFNSVVTADCKINFQNLDVPKISSPDYHYDKNGNLEWNKKTPEGKNSKIIKISRNRNGVICELVIYEEKNMDRMYIIDGQKSPGGPYYSEKI